MNLPLEISRRRRSIAELEWLSRILFIAALFALTSGTFCHAEDSSFECEQVAPGKSITHRVTYPIKSRFAPKVIVSIVATRTGDADSASCKVTWVASVVNATGHSQPLFHYSEELEGSLLGNETPVTSPDGTKLLIAFWSGEGDYTAYRPAVYDFTNGRKYFRILSDRIIKKFPDCDYNTAIQGVTDSGDVIIHVPKSIYDESCADRGFWLLNMKTNQITPLDEKNGLPQKRATR
jgi:hypothetical protein